MRKITLIVVILLMLLPGALASAEETIQESGSCMGIIRNNRLFIPIRSVFTNLGFSVNWDGNAAIIENNKTRLILAVEKNRIEVNSTEKATTDPPILINGRVYIPLRFTSESLKADVKWDDRKRMAVISYNGKEVSVYARDEKAITHYSRMCSVNGKKISVNVVEIPLNAAMPDMVVAGDAVGNREELASMAKRSGATVAINGTFFSAYSDPPLPYGNIIKSGRIVHRGSVGTTCGFHADGTAKFDHVEFYSLDDKLSDYGWGDIQTAVGAGPRLITNGEITVDPEGEGFTSEKILNMCMARSAVGVKTDGTVLLVTTAASIKDLALVMKNLGAHNAMNLDGGASSGLWYKGKYITPPGRLLSNALIFKAID